MEILKLWSRLMGALARAISSPPTARDLLDGLVTEASAGMDLETECRFMSMAETPELVRVRVTDAWSPERELAIVTVEFQGKARKPFLILALNGSQDQEMHSILQQRSDAVRRLRAIFSGSIG